MSRKATFEVVFGDSLPEGIYTLTSLWETARHYR